MRECYDYSKLRGKIKEVFGRQEDFAFAMSLSPTSLSSKLNNKVEFSQDEMNRACIILHIPVEFIHLYFFDKKLKIFNKWIKKVFDKYR